MLDEDNHHQPWSFSEGSLPVLTDAPESLFWQSVLPPEQSPITSFSQDLEEGSTHLGLGGQGNSDEEAPGRICYGARPQLLQITDVAVLLQRGLAAVSEAFKDDNQCMTFNLDMRRNGASVQLGTHGTAIGTINKKAFSALECFRKDSTISVSVIFEKKRLRDAISQSNIGQVRAVADLVIFGPRARADDVANRLGEREYYLQKPLPGATDLPYENPQSLYFDDVENLQLGAESDTLFQEALQSCGLEEDEPGSRSARPATTEAVEDLLSNMDRLFENIGAPTGRYIAVSKDTTMRSRLLPHQDHGLKFMLQREAEEKDQLHSLWERIPGQEDIGYRHKITGVKSRSPDDFLGGILADEMGLGKTFTALAAISASRKNASAFAAVDESHRGMFTRATLVVVPSELLLDTWSSEISRHFYPGRLKFVKYHGAGRSQFDIKLNDFDIVLTTYGTMMSEAKKANSVLHHTQWYRLILDEAHTIRTAGNPQFRAVSSVHARIRWCLTGTPVQNSLDDLGSLIQFLRMPVFNETTTFKRYVVMTRAHEDSISFDFMNLRLILSSICIRRRQGVIKGKGHTDVYVRPFFSPAERQEYEVLVKQCRLDVHLDMSSTHSKKSSHRVTETLLRMRIFCNNGSPDRFGLSSGTRRPDEMLSMLQQRGQATCAHCTLEVTSVGRLEDHDTGYLTPCSLLVCGECTSEFLEAHKTNCNDCGLETGQFMQEQDSERQDSSSVMLPSKIQLLLQDVKKHYYLGDKCIIFSSWRKSLDVIAQGLTGFGLDYLRVDGAMQTKARKIALRDFQMKRTCKILIMTFGTGGAGLNGLTVASRVHILEPQWNPSVEEQAVGRVLRLGQEEKVTIIRYLMRDTIEEMIETKQQKKHFLAGGGFSHNNGRNKHRSEWQDLGAYLRDQQQDDDAMDVT